MVVMIISGITLGLGFTCYRIVNTQFSNYRKSGEAIMTSVELESALSKDFFKGSLVKKTENGFTIELPQYQVTYEQWGDEVLRIMPGRTDTYPVEAIMIDCLLEGEKIEENEYMDEVIITCKSRNGDRYYHFSKWYSAADYLEIKKADKKESYAWSRHK